VPQYKSQSPPPQAAAAVCFSRPVADIEFDFRKLAEHFFHRIRSEQEEHDARPPNHGGGLREAPERADREKAVRSLREEIEQRSIEMTRDEREIRFRELRQKLGIANPGLLTGGQILEGVCLEDQEEYLLLAELLGYKTRIQSALEARSRGLLQRLPSRVQSLCSEHRCTFRSPARRTTGRH
jgi:hypothetical protein